jgi:hypothetical protein
MLIDCTQYNSSTSSLFPYAVGSTYYLDNGGCQGGYIDTTYNFIRDYGIMLEADYPYQGVDN